MNKIPSEWELVQFGDVVKKVERKIPNREQWNFDKYIAGEHIPSGEIRIKDYGDLKGTENVLGSAFHMKFEPGDILYVTRRAYLRKGGLVNFTGVCSNVTFIFNAKKDKLLNELLPFIIQTESFVKHCTDNSHGSTNPFLNWKDIAQYKLLLPPIKEQKKIAKILWGIEETQEKLENLITFSKKFKKDLIEILLTKGIDHKKFKMTELGEIPEEWNIIKLGDICEERKEKDNPPYGNKKYISLEQMNSNILIQNDFIIAESVKSVTNKFLKGDVLYGKLRPYLDKAAIVNFDGICTTEILVIKPNIKTSNDYLLTHFKSKPFIEYNSHNSYGTKMPRTSFEILSKYKIPLGEIDEQKKITTIFSNLDLIIENCRTQIQSTMNLKKKLTNELLSGNLLIPVEVQN